MRMNDALGGILTRKLQGEDAVRSSGVPFAVVRPCALTEEPAGAELVFDQGDTIKVGYLVGVESWLCLIDRTLIFQKGTVRIS